MTGGEGARSRTRRLTATSTALLLVAGACAGPGAETPGTTSAGEWRGTIETEGDATRVVNESGSVWGGGARLVEEAVIGVEAGEEPYMLGNVNDIWATDDRILVPDSQVPAVRLYDAAGEHLLDIGREGEGPGEFADGPLAVAVDPDGRILAAESNREMEVFGSDGEPLETWKTGGVLMIYSWDMIVLGSEGRPWIPHGDLEAFNAGDFRIGRIRIGPEGLEGEPTWPPDLGWDRRCLTYTRQGREDEYCNIPFQPAELSAFSPDGAWVAGVSDSYTFEVHHPDGRRLVVERHWEPVPVGAEEAAYEREQTTQRIRDRIGPDSNWRWNGPEIPERKPAFVRLYPDESGDRVWVVREGPSRRSTDCGGGTEECWIPEVYWWDAFGTDGRFLGSFSTDRSLGGPFIDDDTVAAVTADAMGTIRVVRYRLVLPGGR